MSTPLEPGVKYYKVSDGDVLFDASTYPKAIGSLTLMLLSAPDPIYLLQLEYYHNSCQIPMKLTGQE